jgi:manganese transport protein
MAESPRPDARGLPMATPPDPAALAREEAWLQELEGKPAPVRWFSFLRRGGPGYLQAALTLGGGSASASLLAGATFGYELLWVPWTAMLLGVIVLSAVAHQTLSTGARPLEAMRRHAGPVFAYGWAGGALLSSVVWHFAQYALASALVVDLVDALGGGEISRTTAGLSVLAWALVSSQLSARSSGAGPFDTLLKLLVWAVVVCFGLVVIRTGVPDPGALLDGLFGFSIPEDRGGVSGKAVVLSGLASAVVVNMVFLYPYTLLARGWGRAHRKLARFDLVVGLMLPYVLATGLMIVATANTVHASGDFVGMRLSPVEAAHVLEDLIGPVAGRILFDVGVLGMVLTTITMHMVCTGFVCGELFDWPVGSRAWRWALLIPVPGVLGAWWWSELSIWVAVPTSILAGLMLPIAYLGFVKLQRSRAYLGDDLPRGGRGVAWLGALVLATLVIVSFLGWYLVTEGPTFIQRLLGT